MNDNTTLTLEAGKYYRTRDGQKAYVSGINPFPAGTHIRAIGVLQDNGVQGWDINGSFSSTRESPFDLVAEWVEPKRIKGWLNVDADGHGQLRPDRAQADYSANYDRVACIAIDVLEGTGLGEAA